MPHLNEDALNKQRLYYLENRGTILKRRELKKKLESAATKKQKAEIQAQLAATYSAKAVITRRSLIKPEEQPKRDLKVKEVTDPISLAPMRKWRLLDGDIYFTALKGYTAEEIRLIADAALAAKAKGMETFNPGAAPEKATDRDLSRYSRYAATHSKERQAQREKQNRARGAEARVKGSTHTPIAHLRPNEPWRIKGTLVYFQRLTPFQPAEVKTLLASLKH